MRVLLILFIITLLFACTIASRTYVPSGEEGYSITCSGSLQTWGNCFEKAGELCGSKGYEVITKSDEQGAVIGGSKSSFFGGTTFHRSMIIKCKNGLANNEKHKERKAEQQERRTVNLGTGWVVAHGYVVTNAHVVEGSKNIFLVAGNGEKVEARVIVMDSANDLVILSVDAARINAPALPIARRQAEPGTKVFTIGYPYPDIMGVAPKVTDGIVSSSSGYLDDPRTYQISVALQAGNSGGPLLNMNGEVIGVTTYKLNAAKVFQWTGDLPENVNYAVKIQYLEPLIKTIHMDMVNDDVYLKRGGTLEELSKRIMVSVFIIAAEKSQELDHSSIPEWMRKKQSQP